MLKGQYYFQDVLKELEEKEFNQKYKNCIMKQQNLFTTSYTCKIEKQSIGIKERMRQGENQSIWIKERMIQGDLASEFQQAIGLEIQKQYLFAKQYQKNTLQITDFTTYKNKIENNSIVIKIAYSNDDQCIPILKYVDTIQNDIERKKEICQQLLTIEQNLISSGISHQNIKPNNILFFDDNVHLTDFGSDRTFYQNYINQFTKNEEQKWQKQYHYYNPKDLIDIIKNDIDYDERNEDLRKFQKLINQENKQKKREIILNNPLNTSDLDSWAIGIIIIQIFFPEQNIQYDNINSYYAMDNQNLERRIKDIIQIDAEIGNQLKELFYPTSKQISTMPIKNNNNFTLSQCLQYFEEKKKNERKFSERNHYNKEEQNPQKTSQIPEINNKKKIMFCHNELVQKLQSFMLKLESKKIPELKKFLEEKNQNEKLKLFLDFHELLQLDINDLNDYIKELIEIQQNYKEKENSKLIKENLFLAQNRRQALEYYYQTKNEQPIGNNELPEENIIYYYNKSELTMIQYMKQFQIQCDEQDRKKKKQDEYFSSQKIKFLKKLRKKEMKFDAGINVNMSKDEQKITSIHYLLLTQDKYQSIFDKKLQQKIKFGIEIFPFNRQLKARNKVRDYLKYKKPEYLLTKKEFKSLSTKFQREYKQALYSCLDDLIKLKVEIDIKKQITTINDIFPFLKFKLKSDYINVVLQTDMMPSGLDVIIQLYFQQKFSTILKVSFEYYEYLKQFDEEKFTQVYNGFLVNEKYHGLGFLRVNQNTLQFGIFNYGQILWGWEIKKMNDFIYKYQGKFGDSNKKVKGILKKYEPQTFQNSCFYRQREKIIILFENNQNIELSQSQQKGDGKQIGHKKYQSVNSFNLDIEPQS